MKKLIIACFMLLSVITFAQTKNTISYANGDKIVELSIPITLAKGATTYSEEFDLVQYIPYDSANYVAGIYWRSNDTVLVTVSLDTKLPSPTSTQESWVSSLISGATAQANAGNDTLYARQVIQRGTVAAPVTDVISLGGKIGSKGRLKVVFTSPTTVGNSGTFRAWVFLKKK